MTPPMRSAFCRRSIGCGPGTATQSGTGTEPRLRRRSDGLLRLFVVRAEHELANVVLRSGIGDGPEQCKVPPIAVHDELACREGHASAGTLATAPNCKTNQLESLELAADEVDLCVRELVSGLPVFVAENLDFDIHGIPPRSGPTAFGRAYSFVALLCVCECEVDGRRADSIPQPVLQSVHANEHGICGRAEITPFAISSALPGQLGAVYEHEPRRGICAPVQ